MKEINAFVFDLGNVIVDVNYHRFTDFMGWRYDDFLRFYRSNFFRDYETGNIDDVEFFKKLPEHISLNKGDIQKYRDSIHLTFPIRYEIWGLIHFLKDYYPVFLLTNTNPLDFENLDRWMNLRAPFKAVYTSYEQGYLKPDPKCYKRAEAMFGYSGNDILFFDDRDENIKGAQKAGWHAVKVNSGRDIFQTLVKFGIFDY